MKILKTLLLTATFLLISCSTTSNLTSLTTDAANEVLAIVEARIKEHIQSKPDEQIHLYEDSVRITFRGKYLSGTIFKAVYTRRNNSYTILTCAHAMPDVGTAVNVETYTSWELGVVIKINRETDLALITFTSPIHFQPVVLAQRFKQIDIGEPVMMIGYPAIPIMQRTDGFLFPVQFDLAPRNRWTISAPAIGGSSGSPVFSKQGEVLGVVVSVGLVKDEEGNIVWNRISFCVPLPSIHDFLEE